MTCTKFTGINRGLGLILLIVFLVAGCGPSQKEMMARDHLERARAAHAQAEADQNVATYAQGTLYEAGLAIKSGEQASDYKEIDHQAYLAERKTQVAQTVTEGKMAEKARDLSSREKDQLVYQTKGQVDSKSRQLKGAQREVEAGAVALAQTERERMDAEAQARRADKDKMDAEAQAQQADKERMDAEAQAQRAEREKAETELFIRELSKLMVKQTDRGVIVTLGDVLFATGQSNLSSRADDNIAKLVAFMNKYPNVNVLVEGYTDSVGKENSNLALSQKRAEAVSAKLIAKGIDPDRITTKGYGEEYATADNGTVNGRKQNRRVEVLLLSEGVRAEDRLRK